MIRILYWYWLTWSNASILHALDHICSTNYIMAEKAPSVPWNLCWGNIQPWETRRKRKSNQSNQKKKPRPPDHLNWWSTNLGPPDMISSRTLPDGSSVWVVCETDAKGKFECWHSLEPKKTCDLAGGMKMVDVDVSPRSFNLKWEVRDNIAFIFMFQFSPATDSLATPTHVCLYCVPSVQTRIRGSTVNSGSSPCTMDWRGWIWQLAAASFFLPSAGGAGRRPLKTWWPSAEKKYSGKALHGTRVCLRAGCYTLISLMVPRWSLGGYGGLP